ncbi:MAG: transposase [Bacteroidetes bacterium]|nr:transposase [Bacteroidota bacterium]
MANPSKIFLQGHSVSRATFYKWQQGMESMEASELKRVKELEEENARLKRMPIWRWN